MKRKGAGGLRRAVFLDRDGTLVREVGYVTRADQLRLLPGTARALDELSAHGYLLVLVTNQSAVARGLLSEDALRELHALMERRLGRRLDGIYVCPHHPVEGRGAHGRRCRCRKPAPGLILEAARDLGIDLGGSVLVGDGERDVEAARRAGVRAILVRSGHGRRDEAEVRRRHPGVVIVANLAAAARAVVRGRLP